MVTSEDCACLVLPEVEPGNTYNKRTSFRALRPPGSSHCDSKHAHGPRRNALIPKLPSLIFHLFLFERLVLLQEGLHRFLNHVEPSPQCTSRPSGAHVTHGDTRKLGLNQTAVFSAQGVHSQVHMCACGWPWKTLIFFNLSKKDRFSKVQVAPHLHETVSCL